MDRRSARQLIALAFAAASLSLVFLHPAAGQVAPPAQHPPRVRFIDSATGYAVHPDRLAARPHRAGHGEKRWSGDRIPPSGRFALDLEPGWHTLTVAAAGYQPISGNLEGLTESAHALDFYLDPVEDPEEIRPETIKALQRDGLTLIQGFVADEESRVPLRGARVIVFPSGAQTQTDAAGFFRLHVPVQTGAEAQADPARLAVSISGYGTVEYQHLELWSRGDWTYRIRLERGGPPRAVDERRPRRRGPPPIESAIAAPIPCPAPTGGGMAVAQAPSLDAAVPLAAGAGSATIRVPRNIRVQRVAAGTIDYVTMLYYLRCVLPSEWIPSWADYPGGSNCLSAGAVAVRCYAIAMVNAASTASSYDIPDTESFQVYDPTKINSLTDAAVRYTQDYVVVNGSGAVPTTEYSAENNALGLACGDGYTGPNSSGTLCIYDPVCAGETRYGHGRGMCQWGTARWATARRMAGRDASDATPTGYPRQDWKWIVAHYYPDYVLIQGAPLVIDDQVKVIGAAQTVRMCADGGIGSGVNCPAVGVKTVGSTGTVIEGPVRVTADGKGFTWYKVRWSDAQVGWVPENWLERLLPIPAAPSLFAAVPISSGQIDLSWTDNSAEEFGFRIERARAAGGPWTEIRTTVANVTAHSDTDGLSAQTTYYYRVRAFNSAGNSSYAGPAAARTPGLPPVLETVAVVDGSFVVSWSAIPGTTYRVQFKDDLGVAEWTDLVPDVTAVATTASKSDPLGPPKRFYRVLVIGP